MAGANAGEKLAPAKFSLSRLEGPGEHSQRYPRSPGYAPQPSWARKTHFQGPAAALAVGVMRLKVGRRRDRRAGFSRGLRKRALSVIRRPRRVSRRVAARRCRPLDRSRTTVKHQEIRDNEPNVKPRENKAAAGAPIEGRGQLVLEVACWVLLFALIGVIAYYR
jgi:hypothetical protein